MKYSTDDLRIELRKSLKTILDNNNLDITALRRHLKSIEKSILSEIKGHIQNIDKYMPEILKEQEDDPIIDLQPTINFYNSQRQKVDGELEHLNAMLLQFLQYQANFGTAYQAGQENYIIMNETVYDMFINFINTLLQLNRTIISLERHYAEYI